MILTEPDVYEKILMEIMADEDVSLKDAMFIDLFQNDINDHSIYDIVDYLEHKFKDLDKVSYYMQVYTEQLPDVGLKKE